MALKSMQQPRLMVITQSSLMQPDFSTALGAAIEGGAHLIQLREKDVTPAEVLRLAQMAARLCAASSAQLLINGDVDLAKAAGAGVHLPESQSVAAARRALGQAYVVSQSTHSLAAAQRAQEEGADFVVFGSVFPTATHAGSAPVSLEALGAVAQEIEIPIFAIGGITPENVGECLNAGAHGVAVIRAVWDANDVAAATRRLIQAVGE